MTGYSKPLALYFDEVFLPEVLQNAEPDTKEKYRKAVRKLVSWSGCDIQIHNITEGILERFARNIIAEGMSTKTAKAYRVYLRRIVRHKYPDRCLKECGRRPHENNPVVIAGLAERDLDIEGSLYRFWRDVYVPKRMIGASSGSIDAIRYGVVRFSKFLGRPAMLTDLTDDNISELMAWIINVAGLSVASANGSRAHLLSLWRYAHKRKLVESLPSDCDKLKELKKLPSAWTMEELGQILASAKQQQTPRTGMQYPPGLFFQAMILVAYDTGLRLRALLGVKRDAWKPERREITAEASVMKHKVSQTFQVSEQTKEAVELMLRSAKSADASPGLLFPWPVRPDGIHEAYRGILKRAGLYSNEKNGSFHKLRRTSATHLTAALGIESACRQLGHSSVEMTKRYVDPRLTNEHKAADHLPRPEKG